MDGDGEPTVVVVAPGAEDASGQVESGDVAEVVTDAAVQIAQIEADKEIALAVIEQEGDQARIEAHAEADQVFAETLAENINEDNQRELEECRSRIAELEALSIEQETELATLRAQLTPPPSAEPPPSPSPPAESVAEDGPRESQEAPEPEKPKRKPHRWI